MPIQFDNVSYFTVEEVARNEDVSASYIYKLINEGRIIAKKTPQGGLLLTHDQVMKWRQSRKKAGRPKKLQGGKS